MTKDETLEAIIAGAKANGSWDKTYPDDKKAQPAQEPPSEWALTKNILDEYGLQAVSFVADWKAAQEPRPWVGLTDEEREYWIGCNTTKQALARAIDNALKEKNT